MEDELENNNNKPGNIKEMSQNNFLSKLVKEKAQQLGFEIVNLPETHLKHFHPIDASKGDRCVDGRQVLEQADNSPTGFSNVDYVGIQLPGAVFGILDALKTSLNLSEEDAREIVKKTYETNGIKVAAHIGCGNQQAKTQDRIPGLHLDQEILDDRIDWIKKSGGLMYPLEGKHLEQLSIVNLKPDTTWNQQKAAKNAENQIHAFNCDLAQVYSRGQLLYETMEVENVKAGEKEDFSKIFTEAVLTDYLQTIEALGGEKKIYLNT